MFGLGAQELGPVLAIGLVIMWPVWRIVTKAGYPGWYSIGVLIPVVNVIALFYLAFSEWPALQQHGSDRTPE